MAPSLFVLLRRVFAIGITLDRERELAPQDKCQRQQRGLMAEAILTEEETAAAASHKSHASNSPSRRCCRGYHTLHSLWLRRSSPHGALGPHSTLGSGLAMNPSADH